MHMQSCRTMDSTRLEVSKLLDPSRRAILGQFMTPTAIADYMASLFTNWSHSTRLLDAGAGIGSLSEAFACEFFRKSPEGSELEAHCYEIEPILVDYLKTHLVEITDAAKETGHRVAAKVHELDFIADGTNMLSMNAPRFTNAILNPPYKKMGTGSEHRKMLSSVGIETVNLYTAFLGLAIALMEDGGEIVAIIPRSFCNGTYYRPFRRYLLSNCAIRHIHVFDSRKKAFKDDDVLQENIIIHLVKGKPQADVTVSTSHDPEMHDYEHRQFLFTDIVKPKDTETFIRIPILDVDTNTRLFRHTLKEIGVDVSTGPVVDFRVKDYWLSEPDDNCAPLLYAHHFRGGALSWWIPHKKPNAIRLSSDTRKWLMPQGFYTITKRFSSKEEPRRIVAHVVDPSKLPYPHYGFENHLNVFHAAKHGLSEDLAHGIAIFLNSTVADRYFRNFSGHTQVNATDLRSMLYPSRNELERFGKWAKQQRKLTQAQIDSYLEVQNG